MATTEKTRPSEQDSIGSEVSHRLVWFHHFPKSAGSTVVEIARRNSERFWMPSRNGNPSRANGQEIPIWKFSDNELKEFVDLCATRGVSFVATEGRVPLVSVLASDPKVTLITLLRCPYDRFLSNFFFDVYQGYAVPHDIHTYATHHSSWIKGDNYYVRLLSGNVDAEKRVTREDLCKATEMLRGMMVFVLEENGLSSLCQHLGWKTQDVKVNTTRVSVRNVMRMVWNARFGRLFRMIRYRRSMVAPEVEMWFAERNRWDIELYNAQRDNSVSI